MKFSRFLGSRALEALLKFLQLSALAHIAVLTVRLILWGDAKLLNYLSILELDSLCELLQGFSGLALSLAAMALVYALVFIFLTKSRP
ncbi:MAG: hypothetical protein HY549_11195 [Elusimicrobia bacterium]|nr:hypothetical protein [Elusimicrobiota bacterium]